MTPPHLQPTPHEAFDKAVHFARILLGDFSIEHLNTGTFAMPDWIDRAVERCQQAKWGDALLPLAALKWTNDRWRVEQGWAEEQALAGRSIDSEDFRVLGFRRPDPEISGVREVRSVDSTGRVFFEYVWADDVTLPWARGYETCLSQIEVGDSSGRYRGLAALCWSHMTPEEREKYEHAS